MSRTERTGTRRTATRWPKVYYATQIAVNPVTILMFVNDPSLFDESYRRYLAGRLRDLLPVPEVPIRLLARPKTSRRAEARG